MRGAQRGQKGFSLVELVAVLVAVSVLAVVLVKLSIDYAEEAEKTAMEQVVVNVRAALHLRIAGLAARNAYASIPALAGQNPMEWLSDTPHSYAGAIYGVAPRELAPPQSWYYDTRAAELVYRPARTRHLRIDGDANVDEADVEKEIRFKVLIEQGPLPGVEAAGLRGIRRAVIIPVSTYQWSIGS